MSPKPEWRGAALRDQSARDHQARRSGFTLIELMIAMAILGVVLITSMAVFYERHRRLQQAEEMILVYQALANEAEVLRTVPFGALSSLSGLPFQSDSALLAALGVGVRTELTVIATRPTLATIEARVFWRSDTRQEMLTFVRSDTEGDNLW